jgi:hypothetical protein
VVLGGSDRDVHFADGAQEAAETAGISTLPTASVAAADLDGIERLLADHVGTRLVGIMDDAAYAIFHESVRTTGARLLCLGRHAGSVQSRHTILTTRAFAGAGATLMHAFGLARCSVLVRESPLGAPVGAVGADGCRPAGEHVAGGGAAPGWTEPLAYALMRTALGSGFIAPLHDARGSSLQRGRRRADSGDPCVTFVIDV